MVTTVVVRLRVELRGQTGSDEVEGVTRSARDDARARDYHREHIDMPVMLSALYDFEDLLTNDGCTGIAVLNPRVPHEVQFDEHKLLIVYGNELANFERMLESHGVLCDDELQFITEAEHVHSSCDRYVDQFEQLRHALGMDSDY